ncbi:MAG: hypothetical protein IT160_18755 [Bryobacterales bacterium]|nr:hypothetical protein [Bryobacterales bacterium]
MLCSRRDLFATVLASAATLRAQPKTRLRRKDSFFGLHFDLHPNLSDTALGRDVSEEMVQGFLDRVKPDFVQYDCKGHVGYLGYPSKVGLSAPAIIKDSLAIWRKVTARNGVALYIHFSGVWDNVATSQHPEWAVVDANGQRVANATSTFSPYVDELMIPELKEAASRYDLDGAWIDGDCWATRVDYSEAAARAFRRATGISELPRSAGDPGWNELLELEREQFRRYVNRYIDAIHQARPGFQIASNWFYSTLAPERPSLPLDYISGDFGGDHAIDSGRMEARFMSQQGLPWDLMGWGFTTVRGRSRVYKPLVQLCQEAAVVLAQGGGYQVYYNPTRSGFLEPRIIDKMAGLASFCRERQAVCHHSETIPQVGLLFSTHSVYRTSGRLFGGWGNSAAPLTGTLAALLECRYSVDVLPEWKVAEVSGEYPLLVIPDWEDIGGAMRDVALAYARQGGSLVVMGARNASLFREALGVELPSPAKEMTAFVENPGLPVPVTGLWASVTPRSAEVISHRYPTEDSSRGAQPAATLTAYGKGRIACFYGPAGASYASHSDPAFRDTFHSLVGRVFTPAVEVEAPPTVEVVLRRKNGKRYVHLINVSREGTLDYLPPAGPIHLKSGSWTRTVGRLDIHTAVEIG